MAIHLLRDYQTQNVTTGNRHYIYSYILSIFLRRVLGYSYVGDTNYPINAVGTLLIATPDTNPTGAPNFPIGTKAGINLGAQKEFYVSIPIATRVVSGADIGRLLVLKSTANPRFNSGIFVIVGFETSTNSYVIDYRTLGDPPPVEAADSMSWYLYEKDISCPLNGTSNGKPSSEYRSDGVSNTPRIILQSPHALGWQVRICNESSADYAASMTGTTNCPLSSCSPGFGGTSAGDFPAFGQHFHAPMWFNSSSPNYLGGAPGWGDGGGTGTQMRVTMVGDDTGQGVVMYIRRLLNAIGPTSSITCFGLAENEPAPLPVNNHARLFVLGSGFTGSDNFGVREINNGNLQVGQLGANLSTFATAQGMSATPFGVPCIVAASFWSYISGGGQYSGPHFDSFATDTPYISATELLPLDLIQATLSGWNQNPGGQVNNGSTLAVYPFAPRTMGTIPHLREGRANFGDFSPTTDPARSYQHLKGGLYIPWNGPNLIP
jgi:hypothetical protein